MNKFSSSASQNQTEPPPQNESDRSAAASPPLINDQNDRKADNEGLTSKDDDHKGAGDLGVQRKNQNLCRIEVRKEGEKESEGKERVCRICQLSSDDVFAGAGSVNLVQLGCSCKGELGISHYHCAKAWFMQKGNRICEICGKPAKNIEGIEDLGYGAFGAEIRVISSNDIAISLRSPEANNRCKKSLCNFILAALVLAFLLPWVFRPGKLL